MTHDKVIKLANKFEIRYASSEASDKIRELSQLFQKANITEEEWDSKYAPLVSNLELEVLRKILEPFKELEPNLKLINDNLFDLDELAILSSTGKLSQISSSFHKIIDLYYLVRNLLDKVE